MQKRLGAVVFECLFDLGITLVYAVFVGVLIVAVVASDDGPISILRASLYVSVLPAIVASLIAAEIGARLLKERQPDLPAPAVPSRPGSARLRPSRS